MIEVRRIEVKGRAPRTGDVGLCRTEWIAAERHGDTGSGCTSSTGDQADHPRLVRIQDPFGTLRNVAEISQITGYRVPAASIEERA